MWNASLEHHQDSPPPCMKNDSMAAHHALDQVFCILSYKVFQGRIPHYTGQSRQDMIDAEWTDKPETSVVLWGRAVNGDSVTAKIVIEPTLVVLLEKAEDANVVNAIAREVNPQHKTVSVTWLCRSDAFYRDLSSVAAAARKFAVVFLRFKSMKMLYMTRAQLMTRNPDFVENDPTMREKNIPKFFDTPHKATHGGKTAMVQVVEKFVPLQLQLMAQTGIRPSHWVRAVGLSVDGLSRDHVQLEVVLENPEHSILPVEKDDLPPMRIHSFDIEVRSPEGGFCNGNKPSDAIIAIASSTLDTETNAITHTVHGLCNYTPLPGVTCFFYDSEMSLLEGWAKAVIDENPDFFFGYNINGFDWEYVMTRALRCMSTDSIFYFMGKLCCVPATFKSVSSTTKAFGSKTMFFFDAPGRPNWDLLQFLRVDMPTLEDYSLNAIARKVLGESQTKIDLPIPVMNKYYESGDPELQAKIMEYCVMDTDLPLRILIKRMTIVLQVEMSRVCCVFLNDLWDRGQMFRVSSQFFLHARTKGYVVSSTIDAVEEKGEGYEGATVFKPKVGVHDALVLDFASLYPTTMIANNLCATALVLEGPPAEPDGIEYNQIQVDAERSFTFQQSVPGLIPDLLRNLLEARKRAKKAEQSAETEALKNIMNGRQKALKVAANSIYGTQGAKNSVVGCMALAEATTKLGREGLDRCMAQLKISELQGPNGDKIDLDVIYGDTDSLFIAIDFVKVFGRPLDQCKDEAFDLGRRIAGILNPLFKKPICIEMEKAFAPLVLMAKKCYVGKKYLTPADEGHMDAAGYAIVKRDYCAWQRKTMQVVIERFLMHNDLVGSLEQLVQMLDQLVDVDPRELMLTKRLGSDYKNGKLLQCEIARQENELEPGSGSKPGDRVQYVVCKGHGPLFNRVKPFKHATKEEIDLEHYASHLVNPLTNFFDCFGPEVLARVLAIFRDATGRRYRLLNRMKDLSPFIDASAAVQAAPRVMPKTVKEKEKRKQASLFGGEAIQEPPKKKPRRPPRNVGKQATLAMSMGL